MIIMKKHTILRILFFLQIILIFSFSSMNGPASSQTSGSLTQLLLSVLPFDIDFDAFHFLIRKCAHFTEYAVLGCLAFLNAEEKPFFLSPAGTVIVPCLLVPLLDECLQLFVPERAGMFADCLIDMCGCMAGVIFTALISRKISR